MSAKVPSKREVVQAILSSSPDRLQYLIDQGYDINLPLFEDAIDAYDAANDGEIYKDSPEKIIALSTHENAVAMAYPLHVAVVRLYHEAIKNYYRPNQRQYGTNQAKSVIEVLLDNGALWHRGCGNVYILNTEHYHRIEFFRNHPENMAIHLAMFLKTHESNGSNEYMDWAIKKLQDASTKAKSSLSSLKTTAVLTSVANQYKTMLFSDEFSDVVFQCSDGVSVPAHKMILAASSPYFKTAFQGDWSENNSDGIWKTSHSSKLIKSVLTLVYTGSVQECKKLLNDKDLDIIDLVNLACEYDMKPLICICVDNCVKKLKFSNVRKMLQTAHLHSCDALKKACFKFVQKHSSAVLMSPDMMSLATENPTLWEELGTFLNGPANPNKRARLDGN